jgi:hypothetical protein
MICIDWLFFSSGEIVKKPVNPLTDNYKAKLNAQASVQAGLKEYSNTPNLNKQTSALSALAPEETYL